MTWIFLWDTAPSKIFIGDTEVSKVFVWDTQVRPIAVKALCFTANTAGSTVKLTKTWSPASVTLETSTDWNNWSTYTIGNTITLSNIWDKVYFRNSSNPGNPSFSTSTSKFYRFVMTWSIAWSGDAMYLLKKDWASYLSNYCFYMLFSWCTALTTPPSLETRTLAQYCYAYMFDWCTSLTTPPSLPATSLSNNCYAYMFSWCTALVKLPKLPATSMPNYCYSRMFYWCTNIKLSLSQTWIYQTPYRIPTSWTWTDGSGSTGNMFQNTWWTVTWTVSINTTYYTSNALV